MEFKLGDIVEFGGLRGTVVQIDTRYTRYSIIVRHGTGGHFTRFTLDGRLDIEHTKPLLILIERPKLKRTIEVRKWINIYPDPDSYTIVYPSKEDADNWISNRIACVEVVGTYEIEEGGITMLKPSRELDVLIAEKVMGIKGVQMTKGFGPVYDFTGAQGMPRKMVPNYSTDIAAAWEVVDAIRYNHGGGLLILMRNGDDSYWCSFEEESKPGRGKTGDTAPHAICLASLKALGVET